MTKEELKNKCTERAKIFQQAMESCHSSSPMDCIEWFADRIAELEKENAELKDALKGKRCNCMTYLNFKDLEKENAELKDELKKWKDGITLKDEEIGCIETDFNTFKSKAKELLKRWVELYKPKLEGYPITPIQEQTEQFLNEVESE